MADIKIECKINVIVLKIMVCILNKTFFNKVKSSKYSFFTNLWQFNLLRLIKTCAI